MKNLKTSEIVAAIIFAVWLVIVCSMGIASHAGVYFGLGIVFGVVAFLLTEFSIYRWRTVQNKSLTEVSVFGYVISFLYLCVALVLNLVFCLIGVVNIAVVIPISVNVTFIGIFILARIFADSYLSRTVRISDEVRIKSESYEQFRKELSGLSARVDDPAIRKKLHELQELIAVSQTTTDKTGNSDQSFHDCVEDIRKLLDNQGTRDQIFEAIGKARKAWLSRNSAAV